MFPIHSTIKEIDYSRDNIELYVPFLNKLLIVLPSPYVEDEDALDTELVQEVYNTVEDGNLEDLLPEV